MKEKIMATLMASIMVVVALAAFVAPAQAANPEGSDANPKYIVGGASDIYELGTGQSVTATVDFNFSAYDRLSTPSFKVKVGDADPVAFSSYTEGSVTFTSARVADAIYTITVTAKDAADDTNIIYKINMAVKDTVWTGDNARSVDLDYNYAMNIKVVEASSSKLILVDDDGDDVSDTPLDIQLGMSYYEKTYAKMEVNGAKYGSDKYDFYATGLPAGIYMKSTGEIAGKVIYTESVTSTNKNFYVFAVDVATGEKLFEGAFKYKISRASDSFMYEIDDGVANTPNPVPYDTVGYTAVKNDDSGNITVNVWKADGLTALPANSYTVAYTVSANNEAVATALDTAKIHDGYFEVPISTFADYTGVVEITITSGTYKAIIHTMVVGPLVHSGLAPAVTSA